jgi:cell wall-associated NlpC family hydrolase
MVRTIPSAAGQPVFPLSLGTRLSLAGEVKGFIEVLMDGRQIGWVPKRDISRTVGALPVQERGADVVKTARLFLGAAYLWGGRSMPMPWSRGPVMGVDCSGLVNLVFRALHLELPRDAHDQWMTAAAITAQALRPGDLIFLSRPGEVGSVNHVMLSLGGERFIEAAETGDIVRITTFSRMVGLDLRALEEKAFTLHNRRFYFGRIA